MTMYHFEFIGRDGHVDVASDVLADVEQARDHCRELFEGLGRLTGTRCIRVRVPQGPILFSWPEAAGAIVEPVLSATSPTPPCWHGKPELDTAA
ncbi:MAG TPA: hypothetical protein VFB02_23310 [Bradyrhizobium sp.]|nr:hypothetical protein [Bradyrhizobium sp.]